MVKSGDLRIAEAVAHKPLRRNIPVICIFLFVVMCSLHIRGTGRSTIAKSVTAFITPSAIAADGELRQEPWVLGSQNFRIGRHSNAANNTEARLYNSVIVPILQHRFANNLEEPKSRRYRKSAENLTAAVPMEYST